MCEASDYFIKFDFVSRQRSGDAEQEEDTDAEGEACKCSRAACGGRRSVSEFFFVCFVENMNYAKWCVNIDEVMDEC